MITSMKQERRHIAIVGGGAAGLMAAVVAANNCAKVDIFEAASRIGRPILATGNGRCNISNRHPSPGIYRSAQFVSQSFSALPPAQMHALWQALGVPLVEESGGRLYPISYKASSVLDALRLRLEVPQVQFHTDARVHCVEPLSSGYELAWCDACDDSMHKASFDCVIIATGGATPADLLPKVFEYRPCEPRLLSLKLKGLNFKSLHNVRARARLFTDEHEETGELMFRDYGASGVAIFNMSRFVEPGDTLFCDFLPWWSKDEASRHLGQWVASYPESRPEDLLQGTFPTQLSHELMQRFAPSPDHPLAAHDLRHLVEQLKSVPLRVRDYGSAQQAQVARGGFSPEQFNPTSCEAYELPGLYVVGEALDVDAPCGGFNLHWAWTSGALAAASACDIRLQDVFDLSVPADYLQLSY